MLEDILYIKNEKYTSIFSITVFTHFSSLSEALYYKISGK